MPRGQEEGYLHLER